MNKSSFSQTQLSNIGIAAGVLVMLAGRLGYVIDEKSVAFIIAGVWSLGWTAYSWYQRWKKGDVSLSGWRKPYCDNCSGCKTATGYQSGKE